MQQGRESKSLNRLEESDSKTFNRPGQNGGPFLSDLLRDRETLEMPFRYKPSQCEGIRQGLVIMGCSALIRLFLSP